MPQLAHLKEYSAKPYQRKRLRQERPKGEYFLSSTQVFTQPAVSLSPSEYGEFLNMLEKTESFRFLPRGWDSYDADPPNERSISNAKKVLKISYAQGLRPARVTQSPEGGVAVCYEENGRYSDIECFNTGEVLALTSDRGPVPVIWEIDQALVDLPGTIDRLRAYFIAG